MLADFLEFCNLQLCIIKLFALVSPFFQHGEPGAAVADLQPVDVVVSHVLKEILSPVCEYLESESLT